jgi:hypothetical protein
VNIVNPMLTWTVTNSPDSCTASGDWTGSKSESGGSQSMGVLTSVKTYSYNIQCSKAGVDGNIANATVSVSSAANTSPTVNAGPDKAITLPINSSAPTGVTATDPDGSISSVVWSVVGVPPVSPTITNGSTLNPTFTNMNVPGTYVFRLTATDNLGATGFDDVRVVVSPLVGVVCAPAGSNAFTGCYYNGMNFETLEVSRTDTYPLNFNWGLGSPDPLINPNNFSARWNGNFAFAGTTYRFTTTADDGVRVYVDGVRIIDRWIDQGPTTYTHDLVMTAGTHLVTMEYYDNAIGATAALSWAPVTAIPVITISANPTSGIVGVVNPEITWTVTNSPSSCTASGDWTGSKSESGTSEAQGVLSTVKTYTYTLTCTNGSGISAPTSATVNVVSPVSATITVTSNRSSSWNLSPGVTPASGSGTFVSHSAIPAPVLGTTYTLSNPLIIAGYSGAVTSSRNGAPANLGASVNVMPGDTLAYTITYTAAALPPPPSSFDFSLSGTPVSVAQGSSGRAPITNRLISGTTEPITITATGMPAGVSISYTPRTCTPSPTCDSGVTFTVGPSVTPGTYPIVVSGISSPSAITRQTSVNLTVTTPSAFTADFTAPTNRRVNEDLVVTGLAPGGTPPCVFTWTGTEITTSFVGQVLNINYTTTGTKTLTLTVDCSGVTRSVTKTFNIGVNLIIKEF